MVKRGYTSQNTLSFSFSFSIPDEELLLHQRIHQAYTLLGSFRPGYNKKVNHKKLEANFYNSSDYKNLKLLSSSNSTGTSVCSTCDGCSDRNSEISDYDIDDLFPYHNFSSSRRSSKMNDTTSLKGRHRNASLSKGILDFFRFKIFKPGGSGPSKKFTSRSLDFLVLLISRILIFLLLLLFSIFLTHSHYRSRYYKYGPYEPQKIIKSDPSHNCSITLGQNLEIVPLVSFPGSGNTWLRHLLEEVSGTFTGSVYNDWRIYKKGFTGEYEHPLAKNTLVVKTHLGNPGNRDEKWLPMEEMFDYSCGRVKTFAQVFLAQQNLDAQKPPKVHLPSQWHQIRWPALHLPTSSPSGHLFFHHQFSKNSHT